MPFAAGYRLGPYEIIAPLGAGGMGEVYRARDPRLGRDVAVKVIGDKVAEHPEATSRFEREVRSVAAISHPNILAIHDYGTSDGVAYAAAELLEGETLRQRLGASGGLPLRRALDYAHQMAEGLAAAHEKGIVHRDLKPENLFITTSGQVKILDFGLAQQNPSMFDGPCASNVQTAAAGTKPGLVVGTIGYMAPEQLRGDSVDHRADIFAFGAVFYEMLTGTRAFCGASAADTITAILTADPPEPRMPSRAEVPARIRSILWRCLEKNPADRFQSTRDLALDLSTVMTEPSTVSGPLIVRRRPWIAAGVVFLLLVGVALTLWQTKWSHRQTRASPVASPIHSIAVLPLENLSHDPEQEFFADGMTDALIAQLAQVKALRVISRTSIMRYKRNRKPLSQVAKELGVDAIIEGTVLRSATRVRINAELIDAVSDQHLWAKSFERDLRDVIDLQNDVARDVAAGVRVGVNSDEHALLTERQPVKPLAHENYMRGRYYWNLRTAESMRKGLQYFNAAVAIDPAYALGYAGIADSYAMLGAYTAISPAESFPGARAAAAKALEINPKLPEAHTSLLAVALDYEWDWPSVEQQYRAVMDVNPSYATAHQWYSMYLSALGLHDKALREMERTRQIDPLSPLVNTHVGAVLYQARQYTRAAEECRKTLELEPKYLPAHWYLGHIYDELGLRDDAIAEREIAVKLSGGQPRYRSLLARSLALAGRDEEARTILAELERTAQSVYVSPLEMCFAYAALGDQTRALRYLEDAHKERSWGMYRLQVDPKLDPLRKEPGFIAILQSMKFPKDAPDGQ